MPRPLLFVALTAALAAQERRPAFAHVVDEAGDPVAGAHLVAFASATLTGAEDGADRLAGIADPRVRVTLRLRTDCAYSAFAWTEPAADGSFRTSLVAEDVRASGGYTFALGAARQPHLAVLQGADAWAAIGPLQWQIGPWAANRLLLPLTAGPLPPLPPNVQVRVLDAQGAVLWSRVLHAPGPGPTRAAELPVELPPPQALPLRVVDASGAPMAGVALWQGLELERSHPAFPFARWQQRVFRHVGTTGADGTAVVQVAVPIEGGKVWQTLLIQARKDGCALGQAGIQGLGGPFSGHATIAVPDDQVLPITITPAQVLQVAPPASGELLLLGQARSLLPVAAEEGPLRIRIDAAGRGSLPLPRDASALRLVRAALGDAEPVWAVVQQGEAGCRVDVTARTVSLRIRDALGNPPSGGSAVLVPGAQGRPGFEIPVPLDHAGRLRLCVAAGDWFLWVRYGDQVGWRVLHAADGSIDEELQLAVPARATLRLLGTDGSPQAGAEVRGAVAFHWQSQNPSLEYRFLIERQGLLTTEARKCRTDAEGRLQFPFLPLPEAELTITITGSQRCVLTPGAEDSMVVR